MNIVSRLIVSSPLLGAAMLFGCRHEAVGVTNAQASNSEPAISALTKERCDRQSSCENIGVFQKYSDRQRCEADLVRSEHEELNDSTCSGGAGQAQLERCIGWIREQGCDLPIDSLSHTLLCSPGALCVK